MLRERDVENGDAVVVGNPQRLAGPADVLTTAVEAGVGCPAEHEARRARLVGAEHLMAVPRVEAAHALAKPAARRGETARPSHKPQGSAGRVRTGVRRSRLAANPPRSEATADTARPLRSGSRLGRKPGRRREPCQYEEPTLRSRAAKPRYASDRAPLVASCESRYRHTPEAAGETSCWCGTPSEVPRSPGADFGADPWRERWVEGGQERSECGTCLCRTGEPIAFTNSPASLNSSSRLLPLSLQQVQESSRRRSGRTKSRSIAHARAPPSALANLRHLHALREQSVGLPLVRGVRHLSPPTLSSLPQI